MMYLWVLGNPDLANQLVAAQNARAEVMSRSGYLVIAAVEGAVVTAVGALAGGYRSLLQTAARRRQRRDAIAQLRGLDDRLLKDIGITRGEVVSLVDEALERGPLSLSELRGLQQPVPSATRHKKPARELPLAA